MYSLLSSHFSRNLNSKLKVSFIALVKIVRKRMSNGTWLLGLVSLGNVLPFFKYTQGESNIFFLPERESDEKNVESFDVLMSALRNQVLAAPRRSGKRGQVSEKDWYRNAIKTFEFIRKSEYITEYLQVARKLRDS